MLIADSLQSLLSHDAGVGEGMVWTQSGEFLADPDPERIFANAGLEVFRQTVLRNTGGKIYSPCKAVYRLFGGVFSPLVKNQGTWPEIMYINTRSGEIVKPLLPRIDKDTDKPYRFGAPERVKGRAVYLGMFMPFFGHFLSEVVSRLWLCDRQELQDADVYYHATPNTIKAWNTDTGHTRLVESVLNEFGVTRERIHFILQDTVFDDVICPTPLNRYPMGYHEDYRLVAERIKTAFLDDTCSTPERIFLSRSRFNGRNLVNAEEIENIFRDHGFEIIHPQEHSFGEQIAMAAGADVIAGEEGSAFCNVMFAENPLVIELETGRFHTNLPRLSYMMARKYCHVIPYSAMPANLPVGMKSKLYAHPHVVEDALNRVLEDRIEVEACPAGCAEMYQKGSFASLTGDVAGWAHAMESVFESYPANFSPEIATSLTCNFRHMGPDVAAAARKLVLAFARSREAVV